MQILETKINSFNAKIDKIQVNKFRLIDLNISTLN